MKNSILSSVVILVLLFGCSQPDLPDICAKNFIESLIDGEMSKAQKLCTKRLKQLMSAGGWSLNKDFKEFLRTGRMIEFTLTAIDSPDSSITTYRVLMKSKYGRKHKRIVDLKIEDGKWRVDNF